MRIWCGRPVEIVTATTLSPSRRTRTCTCETAGLPAGDAAWTRPSPEGRPSERDAPEPRGEARAHDCQDSPDKCQSRSRGSRRGGPRGRRDREASDAEDRVDEPARSDPKAPASPVEGAEDHRGGPLSAQDLAGIGPSRTRRPVVQGLRLVQDLRRGTLSQDVPAEGAGGHGGASPLACASRSAAALRLHPAVPRRLLLHGGGEGPRRARPQARGGDGLALHPRAPADRPRLVAPGADVEPGPARGASDQGPEAVREGGPGGRYAFSAR